MEEYYYMLVSNTFENYGKEKAIKMVIKRFCDLEERITKLERKIKELERRK